MSTLNAIRDTFFEECEDLLEAMVEGITAIDSGTWDKETVNAVFRAVHSIKGGAGAFGLDDLVGFAIPSKPFSTRCGQTGCRSHRVLYRFFSGPATCW